jgi:hypothetical protein
MNSIPLMSVSSMDWLDDAACQELEIADFFVQAGHVISEDVLNVCRACPVRESCLRHAYTASLNVTGGYFGGLSPGQRRELSLLEALEFIKTDFVSAPRADVKYELYGEDDEPVIYS